MRKVFRIILPLVGLLPALLSCDRSADPVAVDVSVAISFGGESLQRAGASVYLADIAGVMTFESVTDAGGVATFSVRPGVYTASCTYRTVEDGKRVAYNGTASNITVGESGETGYSVDVSRSESQQIIIKELYCGGCAKDDGTGSYTDDSYVVLYNNSELEADASDIQFGILAPYNAHAGNRYVQSDGTLLYENDSWIPAANAIWWFTSDGVKIPPYSSITVVFFGAVDHTGTYSASVDLSSPDNYVMSNSGIAQFFNAKYVIADGIPTSHYLTCSPFSLGNCWVLSNNSPAFFIARATREEGLRWSTNAAEYDHTQGASASSNVVKYPKSNVVDAVEIWSAANAEKSQSRFPAELNTGSVLMTNYKGYAIYRNVDREATEALPENDGLLVYGYSGGTLDSGGSTDPSGIDAEASIAAGAHIIYSDTNNSPSDFHQRAVASLKKK